MPKSLFELKLEDSPIPQAMDVYYEQVAALVRTDPNQKIALTNNLVDFPMRRDTRLFNAYVARAFADRSISRGSPIATGEQFLGPANINDRFSRQYEVLINQAMAGVKLDLDQEALNRVEESERRVYELEGGLNTLIDTVLIEWGEHHATHLGGLTEDEIALRQVAWLDIHRLSRRIQVLTGRIDRELAQQELIVERTGSEEDTQIYRTYNALRNSKVFLPDNPYIETEAGLDEVKLSNPLIVGTNPSWADEGADVDAIIDWDNFLDNEGSRGFAITRTSQETDFHERKWSARAKVRFGFFFSASVKASEHTKMTETLSDTMSIGMNFDRIGEIWIRRGDWYDSSIFELPKIRQILERKPRLAANLRYSVSSLLIGRGFKLSTEFDRAESYDYYRNFQMSGSAKVLNIFPIGSGSVNDTRTRVTSDDANKTVTFTDNEEVVRLIGFKVDEMHNVVSDSEIRMDNNEFTNTEELKSYINTKLGVSLESISKE
jgi:hypothetical protein